MEPFNWKCPHCHRAQVVTEQNWHTNFHRIWIGDTKYGKVGLNITAIRCANPECNDVFLGVGFDEGRNVAGDFRSYKSIHSWMLKPDSSAVEQPDYIPIALREDYYEACKIRDLSPKASATLARRCLQGMIRDFCSISKGRLVDEISELRTQIEAGSAPKGVQVEAIEAIDAVRGIGNIGAHMERDISLIIDVDPGEAQALIELLELLFEDWYVSRHNRETRLARVRLIAAEKDVAIREGRARLADQKLAKLGESLTIEDNTSEG